MNLLIKIFLLSLPFYSNINYSTSPSFENNITKKVNLDSLIVYGKTVDSKGNLLYLTKVKIKNSNLETYSNKKGEYYFNITESLNKKNKIEIEFFSLGYKIEKRKIKKRYFRKSKRLELNLILKEDENIIECDG